MVNVNVPFRFFAVDGTEVEATDAAVGAVMFDAAIAGDWVTFVCVDRHEPT